MQLVSDLETISDSLVLHPPNDDIWQTEVHQLGHQHVVVNVVECLGEVDEDHSDRLSLVDSLMPVMHDVYQSSVVERPFSAPYWWTSSLSLILSSIHVPTNDSSSLLNVAVSDIGRKSVSIIYGGWALGAGITLASFHRVILYV